MQLFHEIYGIYFKLVSEIIDEAIKSQAQNGCGLTLGGVTQLLRKNPDAYPECISNITGELFNHSSEFDKPKDKTWNLIDSQGKTHIKKHTDRPLTILEKRWLKTLLNDPKIHLFAVSSQGLDDVAPLWEQGVIRTFDTPSDADPYDKKEYRECFQKILNAIHEKLWLDIDIIIKDVHKKICFFPKKLEYSAKDDKFRVEGITDDHLEMIGIAQIKTCLVSADQSKNSDLSDLQKPITKTLSLEIYDNYNTLSRLLIELSNYEKADVKQIKDSKYSLKLKYREGDASELRTRLLGFGPHVKVLEPEEFVDEMRRCVIRQQIPENV